VAGDDKLYVVDQDGTLYVVPANTEGTQAAEYRLDERCATTPALANGCVFVRTANIFAA